MHNIKICDNSFEYYVKLLITNTSPVKNVRQISDMVMTDMRVFAAKYK
jgi:hypothetical protein